MIFRLNSMPAQALAAVLLFGSTISYGQGLRIYNHGLFDTRSTMSVYNSETNSWSSVNTSSSLHATQFATDAFGNMFGYNESSRSIARYDSNSQSWSDLSGTQLGRFNSDGYNLEVTNDGDFLWSERNGRSIYRFDGNTWNSTTLTSGFRSSMQADYDPVTDRYVVGISARRRFIELDVDNLSNQTLSFDGGGSSEIRRLGAIVDGHLLQNMSNQGIESWDLNNFGSSPTNLGQPSGTSWVSGDVDRNTNDVYVADLIAGEFYRLDPTTGNTVQLASFSTQLDHTSLTVVNTDILISGQTFNTAQTAVSKYDHSINSLTVGDSTIGNARISDNSTLNVATNLDISTLGTLTVDSGSNLGIGDSITTTGNFIINGTVAVNGGIGTTGFQVDGGTTTIDGGFADSAGAVTISQNNAGTVNVNNGGRLDASFGYIGFNAGSDGQLNIDNGQVNVDGSFFVGLSGDGDMNITNGGSFTSERLQIGQNVGSTGSVSITGNGSTLNNSHGLWVGMSSNGGLTVENGGLADIASSVYIGNFSGASGRIDVNGSNAKLDADFDVSVGYDGTGTLSLTNQGQVEARDVFVGRRAGSTGNVIIESGAQLTTAGNLYVGGDQSGSKGTGNLTFDNGGIVDVAGTTHVWDTGVVQMHNLGNQFSTDVAFIDGNYLGNLGTFDATTLNIRNGGNFTSENAQLTADNLNVNSGGSLSASGTINSTNGITNSGNISVTNDIINLAINGNVTNQVGGVISTTNFATTTINGDVQSNGGTWHTDSDSGLVFASEFRGYGPFTGGGKVTFDGQVHLGNSPAEVTFEGDLELGSDSSTFVEIGGTDLGDFDRFVVMGDATIGGNLDVSFINSFQLANGMEFLFTEIFGTSSGLFVNYQEGDLVTQQGGINLFITYAGGDGNDIALFTSAVPEPTTLLLTTVAIGLVGLRRRRRS